MAFSRTREHAKRLVVTSVTGALLVAGLTGCSIFADEPIDCAKLDQKGSFEENMSDVAVIIAPTSNFVDFDKALDAATPSLNAAVGQDGARVSVILADGKPGKIANLVADKAQSEAGQDVINKRLVKNVRNVTYCVTSSVDHPTQGFDTSLLQPEMDLLSAFDVAAGSFLPESNPTKRRIIVIGNGIQTAGQYSFDTHGIPPEAEARSIVASLSDQHVLPDLTDVTVDFAGLGLVNELVEPLNAQSKDGIRVFWSRLVEVSGGHPGTVIGEITQGAPVAGSIKVKPVASLPKACINESVAEADGITFEPDSAVFKDQAAAMAKAQELAKKISSSGCADQITVIGYVTSGVNQPEFDPNDAWNAQLSKMRADAFAGLLQQAGVSVSILTVGGGKGPVNEWGPDGTYDAAAGAQNRKVVVTQ